MKGLFWLTVRVCGPKPGDSVMAGAGAAAHRVQPGSRKDECWCEIQSSTPTHGMVLPSSRAGLPSSVDSPWKCTHTYISWVILNTVKLTMAISHHTLWWFEYAWPRGCGTIRGCGLGGIMSLWAWPSSQSSIGLQMKMQNSQHLLHHACLDAAMLPPW